MLRRFRVSEVGGDMIVSLPGTTHPLDWGSNMNVVYQPIYEEDAKRNPSQVKMTQQPVQSGSHRRLLCVLVVNTALSVLHAYPAVPCCNCRSNRVHPCMAHPVSSTL